MMKLMTSVGSVLILLYGITSILFLSTSLCMKPVFRAPRGATALTGCYIIVLKDSLSAEQLQKVQRQILELSEDGRTYGQTEELGLSLTVKISHQNLKKVQRLEEVAYIEEEDFAVGSGMENLESASKEKKSTSGTGQLPWYLDILDQRQLPLDGAYSPEGDGDGVDVYVLDTGINYAHSEFEYRAKYAGYDPVDQYLGQEPQQQGLDCNGHGTHVASLIGGRTRGAAKRVTLYSVRVLNCDNTAPWSVVLDGLNFASSVAQRRQRKAIVSLPLSGSYHASVNTAIKTLVSKGIAVVTSAGNGASNACLYSPASAEDAVTVGGTNCNNAIYGNSNFGPCVDIFAPAEMLKGADNDCTDCSTERNGTSLAAALASGIAAIYLQRQPSLSPQELKNLMRDRATSGVLDMNSIPDDFKKTTPNLLLSAVCGGKMYASAIPAKLQSPNYPQYYDNNLNCKWTIVPPEKDSVKITFDYIKIEEIYDSFKFCVGDECSPFDLLGDYANFGPVNCSYVSLPAGKALTLQLTTDGTKQAPGFSATYQTRSLPVNTNGKLECTTTSTAVDIQLDVASAGYTVGNRFSIAKEWKEIFGGRKRGINIAVLDEGTGNKLHTGTFDTHKSESESDELSSFIEDTNPGQVVLLAVSDEGARYLNARAKRAIQTTGSQYISTLAYRGSWAMAGYKGMGVGSAVEKVDNSNAVNISLQMKPRERATVIKVNSAGSDSGNFAKVFVNGKTVLSATSSQETGIYAVQINEENGSIISSNIYDVCGSYIISPSDSFASFINSLPQGRIVAIAVKGGAISCLSEGGKLACESIGSNIIRQVPAQGSWAIVGTKGAPKGTVPESGSGTAPAEAVYWLPASTDSRNCSIVIRSSGYLKGIETHATVNEETHLGKNRGINVVVLNEDTCTAESEDSFDTFASSSQSDDLADFINGIPPQRIVVAAVWDESYSQLTEKAKVALHSIGSALIDNVRHRDAWAIIGRKGSAPGSAPEVHSTSTAAISSSVELVSDNHFKISVDSAGYTVGNYAKLNIDGSDPFSTKGRGLNVAIIDQNSRSVLHTESFDTHGYSSHSNNFATLIDSLPSGKIVAIAVLDEALGHLTTSAKQACKSIGSDLIDQLQYRGSWAIIGRKGASAGTVPEALSNNAPARATSYDGSIDGPQCSVTVRSTGYEKGESAIINVNGTAHTISKRGVNIAVLTENSCETEGISVFDVYFSVEISSQLANFVRNIAYGRIVAVTVWDTATVSNHLTEEAKVVLESIGSAFIRNVQHRDAWALIGRKGIAPGSAVEDHSSSTVSIHATVNTNNICSGRRYPLNCVTSLF